MGSFPDSQYPTVKPGALSFTPLARELAALYTASAITIAVFLTDFLPDLALNIRGSAR